MSLPGGVVEQDPQNLWNELWQVNLELGAQGDGNVFHQENDGGLEGGVDAPEVLDQVKDGVQVVPDVLLDHVDQAAQLLEKEVPQMVVRVPDDSHHGGDDLGYVGDGLDPQGLEDEGHRFDNLGVVSDLSGVKSGHQLTSILLDFYNQ